MRVICSITSAAALALALTGCAGNYAARLAESGSYNYQPTRSEALNVAVAAGLTRCEANRCKPIDDVPRSRLTAAYQGAGNSGAGVDVIDALTVAQGVGQMAGVVNVVSGLSNIAGGLMTLGTLFEPMPVDNPATLGFVLAWMPKSMAQSPEAARSIMYKTVVRAAQAEGLSGYRTKTRLYKNNWQASVNFIGSGCDTHDRCGVYIRVGVPYVAQFAPAAAGGSGPVYAWPVWPEGTTEADDLRSVRLSLSYKEKAMYDIYHWPASVDGLEYLSRVSARLPEWAYIYSPPTKRHPYPVMFHNGETLLFVEPPTTQTANAHQPS